MIDDSSNVRRIQQYPAEMQEYPHWIHVKNDKSPIDFATGGFHYGWKSNKSTLLCFSDAVLHMYDRPEIAGIGFALRDDDPFIGIDLDNPEKVREKALKRGVPADIAATYEATCRTFHDEILRTFAGAYIERSQSGNGHHIIMRGTLPENAERVTMCNEAAGVEIYRAQQYIWLTGFRDWNQPYNMDGNQQHIDGLVGFLWKKFGKNDIEEDNAVALDRVEQGGRRLGLSDAEVIARAFKVTPMGYPLRTIMETQYGPKLDWSFDTRILIGELDKITGDPDQVRRILLKTPRLRQAGESASGEDRFARTCRRFMPELRKSRAQNDKVLAGRWDAPVEHVAYLKTLDLSKLFQASMAPAKAAIAQALEHATEHGLQTYEDLLAKAKNTTKSVGNDVPHVAAILRHLAIIDYQRRLSDEQRLNIMAVLLKTKILGKRELAGLYDSVKTEHRIAAAKERLAAEDVNGGGGAGTFNGQIVLRKSNPMGNARVFIDTLEHYGMKLVYWRGRFYKWEKCRYAALPEEDIERRAWLFLEKALIEVREEGQVVGYQPFEPSMGHVTNFVEALSAILGISDMDAPFFITPNGMAPKNLIAMKNGLYDLTTGDLHEHTPNFFNLGATEFDYDNHASYPDLWQWLLNQSFGENEDTISCLQESIGYLLTNDTSQQKIFSFSGPPRSGKGTILRTLERLVGETNRTSITMTDLCATFGKEGLIGKSVCIMGDAQLPPGQSAQIAEVLKGIAGEDVQSVNRKNISVWIGHLPTRFVIAANELIAAFDPSGALTSRMIMFQTTKSVLGHEDLTLSDRIATEMPGIFNWAMGGLKRLRSHGKLRQPLASAAAVKESRELGSPVIAFVDDCCEFDSDYVTSTGALFQAYMGWCRLNGQSSKSSAWFGRNLNSAFGTRISHGKPKFQTPSGDKQLPGYYGIRLTGEGISFAENIVNLIKKYR